MSGTINTIALKRDHSGVRVADDAIYRKDTFDERIGGFVDKSDYAPWLPTARSTAGDGTNWDTEYTMTKFIVFIVEYTDLGYYQLKNKCKAIVKTQEPLRLRIKSSDWVQHGDGTAYFEYLGGKMVIDPVLAQAILDSYN